MSNFKKIVPNVHLSVGVGGSSCVSETVDVDGVKRVGFTFKNMEDAYPDMLPASNFSLDAQIKAGVKLTEVDSQVLVDDINSVNLPEDVSSDVEFVKNDE